MQRKPARWARSTASRVSVSEPIWLTLTSRALAAFSAMPRCSRVTLVTNRSSPTTCTLSPILAHQRAPAGPVVLGQRVLDGDDREVVDPLLVDRGHLVGGLGAALPGVEPRALGEELGAGDVEGQGDVGAQLEAGRLDGGGDQLQRGDVGRQVRREAALVAQAGGQALLLQHGLQRVVDGRRPAPGRPGRSPRRSGRS